MLFNLIDRQLAAIQRSVPAQNKALGIDQTYAVAQNTALGQEIKLRKELNNLEASAGSAILPMYVAGLKALNPMLWAVSTWANDHPRQLQALIVGFTGLSAALAFGGTVKLLSGAFDGLKLAMPALKWAVLGNTEAIVGETGLVSAFGKLRFSLLGLGVAAAAVYYMSKGATGHFDKRQPQDLAHWHPAWTKGTWLDKSGPDWRDSLRKWSFGDPAKRFHQTMDQWAFHENAPFGGSSLPVPQQNTPADYANAVKKALSGMSVQMDRQVVGQLVFDHAGDVANRPSTGPGGWDINLSPLRPDFAY